MVGISSGSLLMGSYYLELLRIMGVDMLIPCYTFVFIAAGTVYFLIPCCRKNWWVPLAGFFAAFWISYWVVGLINRLEVLVIPLWLGSAGICVIYGYLVASAILLVENLACRTERKWKGE